MSKLLTNEQLAEAAKSIQVEFAALKAVAIVESRGAGFLASGEPKILFESKVFRGELQKRGIDPNLYIDKYYDVVRSNPAPYGKESEQHARLQKAAEINREAALCSASWGKFQVMGFNWRMVGYTSLQTFINAMYRSEADHLEACINYCKACGIIRALREHKWTEFAIGYNGKGQQGYDKRLEMEYKKLKKWQ